jgi:hypothetical protein
MLCCCIKKPVTIIKIRLGEPASIDISGHTFFSMIDYGYFYPQKREYVCIKVVDYWTITQRIDGWYGGRTWRKDTS